MKVIHLPSGEMVTSEKVCTCSSCRKTRSTCESCAKRLMVAQMDRSAVLMYGFDMESTVLWSHDGGLGGLRGERWRGILRNGANFRGIGWMILLNEARFEM